MKTFPDYFPGSDIDVLCYQLEDFARKIIAMGNKYLEQGFEINVEKINQKQTYIDFYYEGKLDFRFDLYQGLPDYKKIMIEDSYFLSVIENAKSHPRMYGDKTYSIFVPAKVDELLFRFFEYTEWYSHRPDKLKHLDYIISEASEDASRISFFDKLHKYTGVPAPLHSVSLSDRFYFFRWLKFWFRKIKSTPLREIPHKAYRKIFG